MPEKSTKKILFIITKSVWGGAQKYVHDMAVNLPKDHFEPIIAGGGHGIMAEKIISAGLPFVEIKSFQRDMGFRKEIVSFFEILKILFKTKPDVVHVSSSKAGGTTGVALLFYKLFAIRHLPLAIFTVHGWAFLESRPKWQIWLIKLASKITCLFYGKIICVSRNDYTSAIKNKIAPAKKLTIIHLGINPMDYNFLMQKEAQNQLFPNLDIQCPSDVLIGTIGEFTKNKGQKYLIESVNQLGHSMSKLKYVLIGWGESKMNLKSQISNHDLEKSIFVIDKNDLLDKNSANYLKAFDIFVLPSLKEGLPYVILEAGLARLPVIASSVGGIPEIIENGKDGLLVPPANSKELATAIKKLVGNKTLRENLAKNLREKILKEFSLEKMLRETTSLYKKIK